MRYLFLCAVMLICVDLVTAQKTVPIKLDETEAQGTLSNGLETKGMRLIHARAFSQMVISNYNFALAGTETPASGFKVTTTDPSISFTSNYFLTKRKTQSLTIELSAGTTDKFAEIFSGTKLNSTFKGSIGYNILCGGNSAGFVINTSNKAEILKRQRHFQASKINNVIKRVDTARILVTLQGLQDLTSITSVAQLVSKIQTDVAGEYTHQDDDFYDFTDYSKTRSEILFRNSELMDWMNAFILNPLVKTLILKYTGRSTVDSGFADLREGKYFPELAEDAKKATFTSTLKLYQYHRAVDSIEIGLMDQFWTSKRISWWNFTAGVTNNSFSIYDRFVANVSKKIIDTFSVLPEFKVSWNYLQKFRNPGSFMYFNVGLILNNVNSTTDLPKTKFAFDQLMDSANGARIVSTKTGTIYKGWLSQGFGMNLFAECYYKNLWPAHPNIAKYMPGLYGKIEWAHGNPWINPNRVSPTIGLIYNVTNLDKTADVNVLTIIPYISWSDIFTSYSDPSKTPDTKNKLADLFSFGIKLGIPVFVNK